jgi:hypothetical protein
VELSQIPYATTAHAGAATISPTPSHSHRMLMPNSLRVPNADHCAGRKWP